MNTRTRALATTFALFASTSSALPELSGQTRQAFALLRKKLLLSLERLSLALELKALPISNLFEQAGDSLGLFVVHDVLANEANRPRGPAKGPPWGSVLTERSGDLAMHMTQ